MAMRRKPNRELTEEQEKAADEFISKASEPPPTTSTDKQGTGGEVPSPNPVYPWEEPQVREDVKQTYPLRLPEPLHLKLKYVSKKMGVSMNQLCNEAVRNLVNDRLGDILEEASGK